MQIHHDMLVYAPYIITQNATREVLEDACMAVDGGKITAIGAAGAFIEHTAAKTLRLNNRIVMPGLVNSHTHSAMTFLRGLADDLPLMEWLTAHVFPVEKHLTREIVTLGTLLGAAEMLATGTTACQDMYLRTDAVCKALASTGMKARVSEGLFAFPSPAYANEDAAFALLEEIADAWQGHSRIRLAIGPHSVYTTTTPLLQRCMAFAQTHGVPLHIHLAETVSETEQSMALHGMRPVAYCESIGLLEAAASIAHGVELTPEERTLLAQRGVCVVHNPKSNMKIASGVAPVPGLLEAGVTVALGTDGAASNNALNMFSEMSTCALLHKVHSMQATTMPAGAVLDAATLGGAAALAWEGLGCLQAGNAADFIALDITQPNMQPCYNPVSQVVYAASGHEVCLAVVDGDVLYEDGRYTTIDYLALLQEMQGVMRWVREKL